MANNPNLERLKRQPTRKATTPAVVDSPRRIGDSRIAMMEAAAPPRPAKPDAAVYQCGHSVGLAHFADIPCPACSGAARRARNAAEAAKRPPSHGWPNRLPPGSRKSIEWNGIRWYGELTVPGAPVMFTTTAQTERECVHGLHAAFIAHLEAGKGETA